MLTTSYAKDTGWVFDRFTFNNHTFNPNDWQIVRGSDGIVEIKTGDGAIVDEPNDTGQSDLDLIIWGIGWLHAQPKGDQGSERQDMPRIACAA
jgi:hypothetical protein